jgi:hypothetical protein
VTEVYDVCPACKLRRPEGVTAFAVADEHHRILDRALTERDAALTRAESAEAQLTDTVAERDALKKALNSATKSLDEVSGWGGLIRGGH